jgi:hypothetical protein
MTDKEYLEWVAEHLTDLHIGMYNIEISYIRDDGHLARKKLENDVTNMSSIDALKKCIDSVVDK